MSIVTTAYVSKSGLELFLFATLADGSVVETITAVGTLLSGTVSVTKNSPSITFSTSQSLATGQQMTFSTGGNGTVYTISSGGTGTAFTLTANFTGTTSATATCTIALTGPTNIPQLVVNVNGSPVAIGASTWRNGTAFVVSDCPFVAFLFPSAVGPTDVVTYTLIAGGITTAAGSSPAVSSPAAVANYVGQYEPGIGQCTDFTPHRQMPVGVDMAHPHMDQQFGFPVPRNNRLRMVYAGPSSTTATVVWNSTDPSLPDSWTPGGTIEFALCNTSIQNAVDGLGTPSMPGQYSIVFDDTNANNGNALQVWINGNLSNCVGCRSDRQPESISDQGVGTQWSRLDHPGVIQYPSDRPDRHIQPRQ